jgi:hypothetical protein
MTLTERDLEIMGRIADGERQKAKLRIADFVENRKWNKACHSELECQAADSGLELFFTDLEFLRDELIAWAQKEETNG